LKGIDNTPSYEIENNLNHLINELLDPIRQLYGNPIYINSGYRCRALNEAVKGSKTSQHMDGLAADLDTRDFSENVRLFNLIQSSGLPFDQLINESNYSWVHVSYRPDGQNRYQILHL
jgi:uncharacterized protein YcbK (DUF882 family)